ncbi:ribonuclease H-like domain-containing protein [Halobacteria archaeon AArc-m2/3/4]|uniref:Ribonuclease H-like domain-containing protein n=1 Tax=Natronoglomus mannanivorans TaxID=2979990 RepID=A0ABT2QA94_9EURY|nr:ribonuclease H-like domain-containing protein [Halobacteria archaeon AArc-m2/3/4]
MPGEQTFALDIETISTCENPDFNDPAHWIPFAIAVGHQDESMREPEVEVIFREDSSIGAEARMLNDAFDWISSRSDGGDRVLLTYNGDSYDLPILKHRAYRVRQAEPGVNVVERLYLLLKGSYHVDLILDMKNQEGYWVSLDDALNMHSIDADEPEWMGKTVTGADMPEMGLELLSDRPNSNLREAVRRYAASDVGPLFELHAALTGDRVPGRQ